MFVAEAEAQGVIGFVAGGKERTQHAKFEGELYAIYIEQTFQRKKIGSRLTLELAMWLNAESYRGMLLWVLATNPACAFYKRLGGSLLPETQQADFGGQPCTEVSYGWENLREFIARLGQGIPAQPR